MELEDLKKGWDELSGRLDTAEDKLRALTDRATRERADDLRRRTERRLFLPIVAAGLLPLLMYNLCNIVGVELNTFCLVALVLFIAFALVNNLSLLVQLHDIDPIRSTVSGICRRTRRLRRQLLWGVAVQLVLMFALVLSLVICIVKSDIADREAVMYGFWGGLAVGLPIGLYRFMRIYGDIVNMEHSFRGIDNEPE
ncbi:MAG: hypothetical protein J1D86_04235 [Alistipes sp.]|nr:hypothetical protein [Alistipes sp.]